MKIENPFKDTEDKLLFAKVLDKCVAAQKKQIQTHTDFMDPVRCASFMQVLERHGDRNVLAEAFGGYEGAERKMIKFDASDTPDAPFPITPIAIAYNQKFSKAPTHRDYLGAVLGLGVDRGKIGDIRLGDTGAVLYVSEDIAHYIVENLIQVGRVTIKAKILQDQYVSGLENTGKTKRITVPSMRLDAVLSAAYNLSRGKSAALIESEKVFVNWKQAKKTHTIAVGDAITVRGMGRISIDALGGNTKKDRIVLEITI